MFKICVILAAMEFPSSDSIISGPFWNIAQTQLVGEQPKMML